MGATERLTRREAVALLELIDAARLCGDATGLDRLVRSLGGVVPFERAVCAIARLTEGGAISTHRVVNVSYPEEWLALYEARGYAAIDPVVRAHLEDFAPRLWSDSYRRLGRPHTFISAAEDFDLREGYSFGALSPADATATIFSFSVSTPASPHHLEFLDIVAPHFHEAFRRASLPELSRCHEPLTPREREVIQWLANGKSTWDISVILGIGERTVKFHIGGAMRKLGAMSRSHAVAKAISSGIVRLD